MVWSERESAILATYIDRSATAVELEAAFPGRTSASVRRQLTKLHADRTMRRERPPGYCDEQRTPMLHPDTPAIGRGEETNWRRRCVVSNRRFLAQIARVMPAAQAGA
jgi:hypothetical protein